MSAGPVMLAGHLTIPEHPVGIVVFAHGSGSSRHSPRNRYVAEVLNEAGLATLLFDLLTPEEEATAPTSLTSSCWRGGWSTSPVGWRLSRHRRAAGRLLRCQHRRGRGPGRCRRSACEGGGGGVPRRPARPAGAA